MKGEWVRYSAAFKQKVVLELESGKFRSIDEARRVYAISGNGTIQNWIKSFGRNHLLDKVVRVESKDERDRIKELEKEKKQLESALAQEHLRVIALSAMIEVAEETFNIDIKKKCGARASRERGNG